MKAILIDVINENVRMVEVDDKDILHSWYKHLGCQCVDHVDISSHDSIMVDDNGLLTMDWKSKFFSYMGSVYCGNGLVVGVNYRNGNSVDPCISVEELRT